MSNKNIRKKAQTVEQESISNENDAVDDGMDISEDEEGKTNRLNPKTIRLILLI